MRTSPIPPPVWMVIFGTAMWVLNRYYPVAAAIPRPWRWLGWCVMALAPIAPIAAFIEFGRAHTTANPHKPETSTTLVTSGVYSWTRNPMYLGLSILLVGWTVRLGALSQLIGPPLFILLIRYAQIGPEEQALGMRFGEEYERYCGGVKRWIGRTGK